MTGYKMKNEKFPLSIGFYVWNSFSVFLVSWVHMCDIANPSSYVTVSVYLGLYIGMEYMLMMCLKFDTFFRNGGTP